MPTDTIRYFFPHRPLCIDIADCAGNVEAAYINLMPFDVIDSTTGKALVCPALFISDGMSTPDFLQGRYQGDEGISAGHLHDYLYSCGGITALDAFCRPADPRGVADEILGDYLAQHCPGYMGDDKTKAAACELAVRIGGGKSFLDPERDEWRKEVAIRLFAADTAADLNYGKGAAIKKVDDLPTIITTIWKRVRL